MRRFVSQHAEVIQRHGQGRFAEPLGCGKYGCTIETGKRGRIVKITTDAHEVALVNFVLEVRAGARHRVGPRVTRALRRLGVTPAWVKTMPGFVGILTKPEKVGPKWVYAREDVMPLDSDESPSGRRALKRARKGLDKFFYEDGYQSLSRFLRDYPELATITLNVLGVYVLYGVVVEDIHEEQVGVKPNGGLALYDGRISRQGRRRNPVELDGDAEVGGVPNLDVLSRSGLLAISETLDHQGPETLRRWVGKTNANEKALLKTSALLSSIAYRLANAKGHRLAGNIALAVEDEALAERGYNLLPFWARW